MNQLKLYILISILHTVHSFVYFAFYNNELYANIRGQLWDRGYQTLWGLLQLQLYAKENMKTLPNIFSSIDNIRSDKHDGKDIAFWRSYNDSNVILWPEHDYFGWQATWQAPYPLYVKALQASSETISWDKRRNEVYWSGTVFNEEGKETGNTIRHHYQACASRSNSVVMIDSIDWKMVSSISQSGNDTKPLHLDGRRRSHFKFAIYMPGLQWSSALKRIIASGAVLIMPVPNPHQSYVSYLLETYCKDCYLIISWNEKDDASDFCDRLSSIIRKNDDVRVDNKMKAMASRLQNFSSHMLGLPATLDYMYSTLNILAATRQSLSSTSDADVLVHMKKYKLYHFNCTTLRRYHLYEKLHDRDLRPPKIVGLRWQYDEWYDDNCRMKDEAPYLAFTAI